MKNITVSVDEETYRLSRIRAAENGTSVSALVREYLTALAQGRIPADSFEELQKDQDELIESILKQGGGLHPPENLSRDALHDRNALRR